MIDPLYIDENMNICARIEDTKKLNSFHILTMNTKLKRNKNLEKIREELVKSRENAIKCITANIIVLKKKKKKRWHSEVHLI